MSEIYRKEINQRKAKSFFIKVLRDEGRPFLLSENSIESLANILTKRLLEKLEKEKRD
jgi:hypothetical protein